MLARISGFARPRWIPHTAVRLQTLQTIYLHLSSMPQKSARALAASNSSQQGERDLSSGETLSDASLKTCLTCGRMITPRAKWSKNWSSIKYCSDRCRSSRPGKIVVTLVHGHESTEILTSHKLAPQGTTWIDRLMALQDRKEAVQAGSVDIDVEMLVEKAILSTAVEGVKRSAKQGATLEEAEALIRELVSSSSSSSPDSVASLWKALDSPPGLRERIRRAARRLALGITHESSNEQALITTTEKGSIQLLQKGTLLTTVEQLSLAKGVLFVKPARSGR